VTDFMPDGAVYLSARSTAASGEIRLVTAFGLHVARDTAPKSRRRLEAKLGTGAWSWWRMRICATRSWASWTRRSRRDHTGARRAARLALRPPQCLLRAVLERTRELGLLRAVGLSRGQLVGWSSPRPPSPAPCTGLVAVAVGLYVSWAWLIEGGLRTSSAGASPSRCRGGPRWQRSSRASSSERSAAWLPARRAAALDIRAAIAYE